METGLGEGRVVKDAACITWFRQAAIRCAFGLTQPGPTTTAEAWDELRGGAVMDLCQMEAVRTG